MPSQLTEVCVSYGHIHLRKVCSCVFSIVWAGKAGRASASRAPGGPGLTWLAFPVLSVAVAADNVVVAPISAKTGRNELILHLYLGCRCFFHVVANKTEKKSIS